MKTFPILLFGLLLGLRAMASEEDYAVWSSVDIASSIPRAGLVRVSGRAEAGRITKFRIVAFGRTNLISGEYLKKVSTYPLADLKITHESGYEQLGGYSVNVR